MIPTTNIHTCIDVYTYFRISYHHYDSTGQAKFLANNHKPCTLSIRAIDEATFTLSLRNPGRWINCIHVLGNAVSLWLTITMLVFR